MKTRCAWATEGLMARYHDEEWGVPLHEERKLFEFLVLEGAQAGLSWQTILRRRESYREAFDHFDVEKVARYGKREIRRLLGNDGIIRNRRKIEAAVTNAQVFRAVQREFGSFDAYVWRFVGGATVHNRWKNWREIPAQTPASEAMSKDLRKRGFRFVGPIICYAHMQATGMVNDHTLDCFRHDEIVRMTGNADRSPLKKGAHASTGSA